MNKIFKFFKCPGCTKVDVEYPSKLYLSANVPTFVDFLVEDLSSAQKPVHTDMP